MKRQSVKQLRSGIEAAIYLLRCPEPHGPTMALSVLEPLVRNGRNIGPGFRKEKVHRRAHTRKQNGKLVHVKAS